MNKRITALLLAAVMAFSMGIMSSCSSEEEDTVESEMLKREMNIEENDFEDPAYSNEEDGAEVVTMPHDEKDFVGMWQAPSERAKYLWGNINLKINEDGTWKGNITEENFRGRWQYDGSGIVIKSNDTLIYWKLFFAQDGTLMCQDMDNEDDPVVLKPGGNISTN